MDVTCCVYVYEDTSENTIENGGKWYMQLIAKFLKSFLTYAVLWETTQQHPL